MDVTQIQWKPQVKPSYVNWSEGLAQALCVIHGRPTAITKVPQVSMGNIISCSHNILKQIYSFNSKASFKFKTINQSSW